MSSGYQDLVARLLAFREERDWKQFHKPRDLALALGIEVGELAELFLWKSDDEVDAARSDGERLEAISDELADIFIYTIFTADHFGIDLLEAARAKMVKNARNYPAELARGNAKKYTELER